MMNVFLYLSLLFSSVSLPFLDFGVMNNNSFVRIKMLKLSVAVLFDERSICYNALVTVIS